MAEGILSGKFASLSKGRLKIILLWLVLGLVNIAVYFPILKGYLYYDDFQFFGDYQNAATWYDGILVQYHYGYALRFFMDLILWLRVHIFGWSITPYFIISILQNFLVGILVFILAQQLYHNTRVSFIASLVTTIAFPLVQVVTWITGSNVSLLAFFYLGTVILFVQYLATRRKGWYAGFLICFIVATYTLEYAVSLLPVLIVIGLGLCKEHRIP